MSTSNVQEEKARDGLARLLFKNADFALSSNLINGFLWAFAIWGSLVHTQVIAWLVCLLVVTLFRWRLAHIFHTEARESGATDKLVNAYGLGALAAGVVWSSAAIMLIRTHDPALQALAGFLMAGMAAGAVATNVANLQAYYAFALPMLVPLPPLLILEGGRIPVVMGVMSVAFILIISRTVRMTHETLRRTIALGHENEDLVIELNHELDERVKAEAAMSESERTFRVLAESTATAIFTYRDHFLYVNPAGERLCGYSAEELCTMPFWAIVHPDHRELVKSRGTARCSEAFTPNEYEFKILTKSGDVRWLSFSAGMINHEGRPAGLGTAFDITARKAAEEALFLEKELAQVTLKSLGDAVVTTDPDGRVLSLNPAGEALTGWTESEAQGQRFGEVIRLAASHRTGCNFDDPVDLSINKDQCLSNGTHLQLTDKNGVGTFSVELSASPIRDRSGKVIGAVAVFHDVSALSYAASHDALTGLVNRREFLTRLEHAVASTHIDQAEHALCYIDLDQFKIVNDTCGHAAGDELLKQLTALLQSQARDGDTFARLGGDEFGLLLPYCPLEKATEIAEVMRKLTKEFRFSWGERAFEIGASIGVVHIHTGSGDVAELMRAADSACYVAKAQGRNRVHLYKPDDTAVAEHQHNIAWVTRIRQGLDRGDFGLYFQPIQRLGRKGNEHFEVLLRLHDGRGKLVLPSAFLPAAERYDLMPTLDRWIIRTALAQLGPMLRENPDRLCAINLSGQSLGDEQMVAFILEEIASQRIPPASLCFEITETSAISHLKNARDLAHRLKAAGCSLALDDFGSGLSSFSYLKELPVDFLKIDGAFIKNIAQDPTDRAIVSSIVQVARAMGKETIAEYVENESSLYWVRTLDVDCAQGYCIGRPKPLEELVRASEPPQQGQPPRQFASGF
jgi:diguanylate cyclase (GGDEF)-like protein/PAS domain S-box-containing protein